MPSFSKKIFFVLTTVFFLIAICFALPIDNATTAATRDKIQDDEEVLAPISKVNKVQSELIKSIVKKSVEEVQDLLFDAEETDTVRVARDTKSDSEPVHRRRIYHSLYPKYYEEAEWPALI